MNHRNSGSIFILNLLLGWTFIGWVAALIWAFSNDKPQKVVVKNEVKSSNSDELLKLKNLLDTGVLNQEEFDLEKAKVLNK